MERFVLVSLSLSLMFLREMQTLAPTERTLQVQTATSSNGAREQILLMEPLQRAIQARSDKCLNLSLVIIFDTRTVHICHGIASCV